MKIKLYFFEEFIDLEVGKLYTIIIENRKILHDFEKYLFNEFEGNNDYLLLMDNNKIIDHKKNIYFLSNFYDMDLNNKKNLLALYKQIKVNHNDELKEMFEQLTSNINDFFEFINFESEFDLTFDSNILIDDVLKLGDLRFNNENDSLFNSFISYLEIINNLFNINVFVVEELHKYFSNDDLIKAMNELKYHGIILINIEKDNNFEGIVDEIRNYIDIDYCTIQWYIIIS